MARIKNINGISKNKCNCGSWLRHWEKFSGQTTSFCTVTSCLNKYVVGAHVQKTDSTNSKWYIVPLCTAHNRYQGELEVSEAYAMVSANRSETCEKH